MSADIREGQHSKGPGIHLDKRKRASQVLSGADIDSKNSRGRLLLQHVNAQTSIADMERFSQSYNF